MSLHIFYAIRVLIHTQITAQWSTGLDCQCGFINQMYALVAFTCSWWSHLPWPPGSSPHWFHSGYTQSEMKGFSYEGAGSCPCHKSAVYGWDRRITFALFYTCMHISTGRHVQKPRCMRTQKLTYTDTHCSPWPSLTCSWPVHLQTLNGLELFPLEVQLFELVVQTLKKKHSQSEQVAQWNDGSLLCVIMPQDYP